MRRLRELESALESVPDFARPRAELEQYKTSAALAARVLWSAAGWGDIAGRSVADLGCGTGVLARGAALLGAAAVTAVDLDESALAAAAAAAAACCGVRGGAASAATT